MFDPSDQVLIVGMIFDQHRCAGPRFVFDDQVDLVLPAKAVAVALLILHEQPLQLRGHLLLLPGRSLFHFMQLHQLLAVVDHVPLDRLEVLAHTGHALEIPFAFVHQRGDGLLGALSREPLQVE